MRSLLILKGQQMEFQVNFHLESGTSDAQGHPTNKQTSSQPSFCRSQDWDLVKKKAIMAFNVPIDYDTCLAWPTV